MADLNPAGVTSRSVLAALTVGFAIVVGLLTLSAYTSLRSARLIQEGAARLSLEQIAAARLLNSVQADQHALAEILHRFASGNSLASPQALKAEMDDSRAAIRQALREMPASPLTAQWQSLDRAISRLAGVLRSLLDSPGRPSPANMEQLFRLNDEVISQQGKVLETTSERIAAAEKRLQTESQEFAFRSQILLGACFVISLICAVLTIYFARRALETIQQQASELSRVSWHLLQEQEVQARRFAHELHDELGQSLAGLKALLHTMGSDNLDQRRNECLRLTDESIANIREMSRLLHPVILDDFGLDAALRWLADGFGQRTGIEVQCELHFTERLTDTEETHLFRIAQEALTNVSRHARATRVRVRLAKEAETLRLVIEDNGRGLSHAAGKQHSLGLVAMRARAAEIGATFRTFDARPSGLKLEVAMSMANRKTPELA